MRVRVASAGTGKTTSLVRRYLELIDEGRPLRRVAGVTFTRAAAAELRQRVDDGVHEVLERGTYLGGVFTPTGTLETYRNAARELDGALLSTIHGFMNACLRLSAPSLGLDPDFGVLAEWEAAVMFEEEVGSLMLLAEAPDDDLHESFALLGPEVETWLRELFARRSLNVAGREATPTRQDERELALERVYAASYRRYRLRLGSVLLAPGEIELRASRMLEVPLARQRVAERFPIVLVDEYQDVNPLQGQFFERLEANGVSVEVVGDPKQSIYGFRNADVGVFRRALARAAPHERLEPLTRTRRHARTVAGFLNAVTAGLAARQLGFEAAEAPSVEPAGAQALVGGSVELHWVVGDEPIARLREEEGRVLAAALRHANETLGIPYDDMAVLARSYASLAAAGRALSIAGVPNVLLQGRGYYDRSEIRDLYHALRVGIAPEGLSLAAFLRGPFGQLPLGTVDAVLRSEDPLATLAGLAPEVEARIATLRSVARSAPMAALKRLVREPLLDGKPYTAFLGSRARENVDALLFQVAASPPRELEVLLDRLDLLSRQAEAGDVPQSGAGVRLLTIHASKGLEFRLVAVADVGRGARDQPPSFLLDPETGRAHLAGGEGLAAAYEGQRARDRQEGYRLLYVALSRARDALLVTGSVKRQAPSGWAETLAGLGFGPSSAGGVAVETSEGTARVEVRVHPFLDLPAEDDVDEETSRADLEPAAWTERRFASHRYPPVFSPSRLKAGSSPEPRPPSDPQAAMATRPAAADAAGSATAIGTLVHYAISQDWDPDDPFTRPDLLAQEVMFAFTDEERDEIVGEVEALVRSYRAMLGTELPLLQVRERDLREVPTAIPIGSTVWQGVIDRLYKVDAGWVVEDYKTDRAPRAERYHFQLALYVRAAERVLGIRPRAQLVFLRSRTVVPVQDAALRTAFDEALADP